MTGAGPGAPGEPPADDPDPGPGGGAPLAPDQLEELTALSEQQGLAGVRVAAELLEDELRSKSGTRRVVELVAAAAVVVVIFVRVIPTFLDVEYAQVWPLLADIEPQVVGVLVAVWVVTMWCYSGFLVSSLPGLRMRQGVVMNFSGSALANVVPFGGAAGIGATYAQGLSWGFTPSAVTLSVLVSGVWNVFAKLGLPIVVVGLLAASGEETRGFAGPALVAVAVLAAAVVLFAAVVRSDRAAVAVGGAGDWAWRGGRRLLRRPSPAGDPDGRGPLTGGLLDFRHRTVALVRRRWLGLTLWMVAFKVGQGVLQLLCARAVGIDLPWVEVFAVYSLGELLTTIPLTPSGVGLVEAGSAGLLAAFGAPADAAVAAVLLYRAFTYLFEIPLGVVGWGVWAGARSWRRPPGSVESPG